MAEGAEAAGAEGETKVINADEYLSYWKEESGLKQQLVPYMEAITDESSPDYIPGSPDWPGYSEKFKRAIVNDNGALLKVR